MAKLTQKWAIIAPLEFIKEGAVFTPSEFPLHITLAGVFAINLDGATLARKLSDLISSESAFTTLTATEDRFGPHKDIRVVKLQTTPELMAAYSKIHAGLLKLGAVFNEPHYEGDGYIPHSTIQKHARLATNQAVTIYTVAIIDLFPNEDGHKRRIAKIFTLVQ